MSILVGTASWTDKTLIESGAFYPPGCSSAEARLRYYASVFSVVEVDSSYYAMPSATNSALWVERTPPGFVFDMNAFRLFTGLYYKDVPAPIALTWSHAESAVQQFNYEVQGRRVARTCGSIAEIASRTARTHVTFSNRYGDVARRCNDDSIACHMTLCSQSEILYKNTVS
ncbi:DUF72 domain-containing protein [Burkholderia dolosa]|nr:DUF72 domain-containing protein [Burkholderia dolosa]MBR8317260.1 DUF72 domain-containing protein [Burkholderia dolosa]